MDERAINAEERFRSIPRMVVIQSERFADDLAVLDGEIRLSFTDVVGEMLAVGRAMVASGIEPGDTVAVLAPNCARWISAALGAMAARARVVPVNTRFKGGEIAQVLRKADVRMLVVADGFLDLDYLDMIRAADPSLRALGDVVELDAPARDGAAGWQEFLERGEGVEEAEVRTRIEAIEPDDESDVLFTSGTTGRPKGVRLRHGTSLRAYELFNTTFGLEHRDRSMVVSPFFHTYGNKGGWMTALMVGGTVVPVAAFEPGAALDMIERDHITHVAGAPTLYQALLDHPTFPQRDVSSLKVCSTGASHVPEALPGRMRSEFGLRWVISGYGMTETHGIALAALPDDPPEVVAQWSGRPRPGILTRIVDDDGNDLPLGEQGELLLSGFVLTKGYLDDPEQTAAAIDADGWLHTGDIAYASETGYLKVCDRKKDLVIVGGFNVAPAEVDGMLSEWGLVTSAAAVGMPDEHCGEVIAAFVVPAPGVNLTGDDVIAWCREHMANYKVPRRVEIVDALPQNATGKVLKDELRARLAPRSEEHTSELQSLR